MFSIHIDNVVSNKYNSIVDKRICLFRPLIGFSFTSVKWCYCYTYTRCIFLTKIKILRKWAVCKFGYFYLESVVFYFWIRSSHFAILVFRIDHKIFPFYFLLVQCFDVVVQCNSIDFFYFDRIYKSYLSGLLTQR